MKPGDVVRVSDWPGTIGRRFTFVTDRPDGNVELRDGDGRSRFVPRAHVHVDRKRTRARKEVTR